MRLSPKLKDRIKSIIFNNNLNRDDAYEYVLSRFVLDLTTKEKESLKKYIQIYFDTQDYLETIDFEITKKTTTIIGGK